MLSQYTASIAALQAIRWTGEGQMKINDYITYYEGMDNRHHFETGFEIHKRYESCVREFNPIAERISTIQLRTKPIEICLVNKGKVIGLKVNDNKTKVMELLPDNNQVDNDWSIELNSRIIKAEKA